jgi:hypothetical protein
MVSYFLPHPVITGGYFGRRGGRVGIITSHHIMININLSITVLDMFEWNHSHNIAAL